MRSRWRRAERLAYAVTRARAQLLLLWVRCVPQQSVLQHWLFEADTTTLRDLPLSQRVLQQKTGQQRWRPPQRQETLSIGATPQRIDRSWGRSSYSAWIAAPAAEALLEQGRDQDPGAEEATAVGGEEWPDQGPLAEFPVVQRPGIACTASLSCCPSSVPLMGAL